MAHDGQWIEALRILNKKVETLQEDFAKFAEETDIKRRLTALEAGQRREEPPKLCFHPDVTQARFETAQARVAYSDLLAYTAKLVKAAGKRWGHDERCVGHVSRGEPCRCGHAELAAALAELPPEVAKVLGEVGGG